jgi:hypothetical protein
LCGLEVGSLWASHAAPGLVLTRFLDVPRRAALAWEIGLFVPILPRSLTMDMQQYLKNRQQFPFEELEPYAGRYVAWSPDGTQILTSDEDPGKVIDAVKALGYDPGETVIEAIPSPDEVFWGGTNVLQEDDRA